MKTPNPSTYFWHFGIWMPVHSSDHYGLVRNGAINRIFVHWLITKFTFELPHSWATRLHSRCFPSYIIQPIFWYKGIHRRSKSNSIRYTIRFRHSNLVCKFIWYQWRPRWPCILRALFGSNKPSLFWWMHHVLDTVKIYPVRLWLSWTISSCEFSIKQVNL